jgi:TolB-like protein
MAAVADFARKFELVLKTFNLSRGRLAQSLGVDKSVVSRWASGVQAPVDHNLALLTEAVARHKVDFSRSDWDLDTSAFKARLGLTKEAPDAVAVADPALPDRPSIAVLPFTDTAGGTEGTYFADGIVEDIITALSRFSSLFVIARSSSFTYRDRSVDIKQVGRELGVRYVLEGSVRRAGGQLRITAQLVDAASGSHQWGDRYDAPAENLFQIQDRITEAVAGVMEPAIRQAEITRVRRKRPEHMGAYEHYLRSLALAETHTAEATETMLAGCRQAIALDPSFSPAYALAARSYIQRLIQGRMTDLSRERAEALDLVEGGLRADRFDQMVLATAGLCFAFFERDLAKGVAFLDEAVDANPNFAYGLSLSGLVRTRSGDTGTALAHLERALRLSPRDSRAYATFHALAFASFIHGDFAAALVWARRAVQQNANYNSSWLMLAASAAATGHDAEARAAAVRMLALTPGFSISVFATRFPIGAPEKFAPLFDALRRAGVPD